MGSTAARGHACMLNWVGEMPPASHALDIAGLHWHDYGKSPRPGRKVGHATLCADTAHELVERLQRVGRALDREDHVAPVIAALTANGTA